VLSRKEDESPTDFCFTASCKTLTANRGDRSSVAQNRPSDIRSSSPKASIVKYALPSKLEQGFENCGLVAGGGDHARHHDAVVAGDAGQRPLVGWHKGL